MSGEQMEDLQLSQLLRQMDIMSDDLRALSRKEKEERMRQLILGLVFIVSRYHRYYVPVPTIPSDTSKRTADILGTGTCSFCGEKTQKIDIKMWAGSLFHSMIFLSNDGTE